MLMAWPLLWDCGLAARQGESGNVTTNSPEPGSLRERRDPRWLHNLISMGLLAATRTATGPQAL